VVHVIVAVVSVMLPESTEDMERGLAETDA
jgi:hypothetical protein